MGLKEWFNSKLKLKRWLLFTLVGVFFISYSLAKIFSMETMEIKNAIQFGIIFVVGCVCVVFSYIMSQRQLLMAIAEATTKSNGRSVNIKKLLLLFLGLFIFNMLLFYCFTCKIY